ncbi:helix-turn-helix transcriptional regulator [Cyclobacterium plantarum]|uniref:helix-turn-helix transcriptional regulator n=1 Tax=Cyclobacterium plantarum TaxID=2716263 RepID=UPI003F6E850A
MSSKRSGQQGELAAKIQAFRMASDWIPGIKIIQRTEPWENLFICSQGKERYGLSESFFQHLPSHEFRRLIFDPESPDTCLLGPSDADDNGRPSKKFYVRRDRLNDQTEMELISVFPILPDSPGIGNYSLIQIIPIDLQSWAAPKTSRIARELSFQKRNYIKFRQLSDRNKEVLSLIGRCKKAEEIGEELFIGVNTVNSHKKRIKELLETNDTWELIQYGLAFDLI